MTRKAKIIATLGNSTEGLLEEIVAKGADAVLIDTYYGSTEESIDRINKIKELREKLDKNTAIIYDLDHIYAESKYKLIKIEEDNVHTEYEDKFIKKGNRIYMVEAVKESK